MNENKFKGRVDYILGKLAESRTDKSGAVQDIMNAFNDQFSADGCPQCGDLDIYDTEHIHMDLDRVEKYVQCGNGHWYEVTYLATSKEVKRVEPG